MSFDTRYEYQNLLWFVTFSGRFFLNIDEEWIESRGKYVCNSVLEFFSSHSCSLVAWDKCFISGKKNIFVGVSKVQL